MNTFISVISGLCWGSAVAFANSRLLKKAIEKQSVKHFNRINTLRVIIDVAAIAVLFFLKSVLPINSIIAMLSTAVAISVLSTVLSFKIAAAGNQLKKPAEDDTAGNEKQRENEN